MSSADYKVGELVWAKMKGFAPWPGRISTPLPKMKKPKGGKSVHCVFFFGSNNFAWIEDYAIKPYMEHRDKLLTAAKSAAFKDAVAAIDKYIAAKKAGEDVDAEFDQGNRGEGKGNEEEEEENAETEEAEEDLSDAEVGGKKRRRSTLSHDDSSVDEKKEPAPSVGRKKRTVQENGDSTPKVAKKPRKSSAVDTPSSSVTVKQNASGSRKSVADNLLNRPTLSKKPEATPLDVTSVSQTLKNKKIEPSTLRFGFVGLGNIGGGIVKNLLNSGHDVTVWNRSAEKCKDFIEAGAKTGETPSDVVASSDVIFACISNSQTAKELVFGNCGICAEMTPDKGYIEMTSIDSESSLDIADGIRARGGRYLEAQILGTKTGAQEGTLIVLSAGDRTLFDDCESAFAAMCSKTYYMGDIGNACKMNAILQVIQGVSLVALTEGMALADRANLDGSHVLEILSHTPFNNKMIQEKGRAIIDGTFAVQQPLQYMQKDLNHALQLGHQNDQPMPVTASANEVFKHAKRLGYGDHDCSAVYIRARF